MADNVLGVLFSDIADAIRGKTGDTATMKPAEFPEKISGIETGSGGSLFDEEWLLAEGSFTPTTKSYTVTHNIGVIPEILIVYIGTVPVVDSLFFSLGFNRAMMNLFPEGTDNVPGFLCILLSAGNTMVSKSNTSIEEDGAYNGFSGSDLGVIRDTTATTFTVGGGTNDWVKSGLSTGKQYYWKAYYRKPATE